MNQPFIAWLSLQPTSIHPHSATPPGVDGEVVDGAAGGIQVTCGDGFGLALVVGDGVGAGSALAGAGVATELAMAVIVSSAQTRNARCSQPARLRGRRL
ncbi:hypothetical protein [Nonomuraea sp. NPDC050540]|uniref:hypothetical protein n=1 Tax=Nonomuraea sp. NPDC050540 TaxID=3364367 RepID=UPI003788ACCD